MSRTNIISLTLAVMSALGAWLTQLPAGPHWFTPNSVGALFLLVVSTVSGTLGFSLPAPSERVVKAVEVSVEPEKVP